MESCPFEASTKELSSNVLSSSCSSRSRRGLLGGTFKGVDDRHKGSALDVPTPKSLQDTVAWTPVAKINFTKESLMKQHIMKAKRNARILTNYIKSKCTEGSRYIPSLLKWGRRVFKDSCVPTVCVPGGLSGRQHPLREAAECKHLMCWPV